MTMLIQQLETRDRWGDEQIVTIARKGAELARKDALIAQLCEIIQQQGESVKTLHDSLTNALTMNVTITDALLNR